MKFVKGRLYRAIKDSYAFKCKGCILRYVGSYKNSGQHYGKIIKAPDILCRKDETCPYFDWLIDNPKKYGLVEYEGMVKFCKKLKEKLDGEKK